MKQLWQKTALRIDALSLRERAMVFVAVASVLITLINSSLLDPQLAKQRKIADKVKQEQGQIATNQAEIDHMLAAQKNDPDVINRDHFQELKKKSDQMHAQLQEMQKSLVAPDKMAVLLEDILRRNSRLQLLSLKTLEVANLTGGAVSADTIPNKAGGAVASVKENSDLAPAVGAIYKHGVEIVVQGGYLDMMNTMASLEAMPWQLFWGKATLKVDEYPKTTLTLTLYTLSLDKKWLNI